MSDPSPSWATHVVLLPVKAPTLGKSRILGVGPETRAQLALAFALDTARAALATSAVGVVAAVTEDAEVAEHLVKAGCALLSGHETGELNSTLRSAAQAAHARWPELQPVALCADLPSLRPAEFDQVLRVAGLGRSAYVADSESTGTTMFTAALDDFEPHYGIDSAARHRGLGAVDLVEECRGLPRDDGVEKIASVRRDVDTWDALTAAAALGVGPATAAVLAQNETDR